ncbi:Alpha-1,2-mannosyltransferase ALG9 [Nymphon striatum]|nr:Alpha-1,2-mannosyltransferase ALG9 [Nymphon striatum]
MMEPWTPSLFTAFKALLSARLCAAIWSNISDCDETFNYWEPTHFLMYGKGFQTWEYSPVYAIRSYGYLWLHALPGLLYSHLLQSNKILVFFFLRCILAFVCSLCEIFFYKGVSRQFGVHVGRLTLCFLILSTGMFISSVAYLPSTFSMYMTLMSYGAWFMYKYELAIFCTAVSVFVGWPFAAILGMPIAFDILVRKRKNSLFLKWCLISVASVLVPLVHIDTSHYGRFVMAPLNIVLYNVFSDHGPDIYGVEPWTFYFLNASLNFNIIFAAALFSAPILVIVSLVIKLHSRLSGIPTWLVISSLYLWIVVFFTRAHKEERFLFPIYPLFCLAGAISLDGVQKLYYHFFIKDKSRHYLGPTNWLAISFCIFTSVLSLSRSVALYKSYNAPMDVYMEMNKLYNEEKFPYDQSVNVCVGKEWYRYPSSFFLPNESWNLQFIKSEFRGQLPQQYQMSANATMIIPEHMNDGNLEETSRYVGLKACQFIIDLDVQIETAREPRYSIQETEWKVVVSKPFLDNERFLEDFYPKITFLSLEEPDNAKAHGILAAIDHAFERFDMAEYKLKTVGFCSDGASAMMGHRQGVIKLLTDSGQVPWVLSVWCLAHHLELAMKDSFKGEYLETVVETLTSVHYFYEGSAKRNKEAADIAELMEETFLKPERCNGTRWVDHKLRAVSKLIKIWKILIMHFMSHAEDNTNGAQYRAKAKGVLWKLTQSTMGLANALPTPRRGRINITKLQAGFSRRNMQLFTSEMDLVDMSRHNKNEPIMEIKHDDKNYDSLPTSLSFEVKTIKEEKEDSPSSLFEFCDDNTKKVCYEERNKEPGIEIEENNTEVASSPNWLSFEVKKIKEESKNFPSSVMNLVDGSSNEIEHEHVNGDFNQENHKNVVDSTFCNMFYKNSRDFEPLLQAGTAANHAVESSNSESMPRERNMRLRNVECEMDLMDVSRHVKNEPMMKIQHDDRNYDPLLTSLSFEVKTIKEEKEDSPSSLFEFCDSSTQKVNHEEQNKDSITIKKEPEIEIEEKYTEVASSPDWLSFEVKTIKEEKKDSLSSVMNLFDGNSNEIEHEDVNEGTFIIKMLINLTNFSGEEL